MFLVFRHSSLRRKKQKILEMSGTPGTSNGARKGIFLKFFMKNLLVKLLVALVMLSAQISVFAQPALESLYRNKQCFDLRDELVKYAKETSPELLFYRGVAANRFNRLAESIEFLQKYLENSDAKNPVEAYETLADSYAKNYEY